MNEHKRKRKIKQKLEEQVDRESRRSPYELHYEYTPPEPYVEPLKFCVNLIHAGKRVSDAIYITRLTFTNPETPHYVPLERWNSNEFAKYMRRWFKAD